MTKENVLHHTINIETLKIFLLLKLEKEPTSNKNELYKEIYNNLDKLKEIIKSEEEETK